MGFPRTSTTRLSDTAESGGSDGTDAVATSVNPGRDGGWKSGRARAIKVVLADMPGFGRLRISAI